MLPEGFTLSNEKFWSWPFIYSFFEISIIYLNLNGERTKMVITPLVQRDAPLLNVQSQFKAFFFSLI